MDIDEVTVTVHLKPLMTVLKAINGPPHLINEMRIIMSMPEAIRDNSLDPLSILIKDCNAGIKKFNTENPS